MTDVTVELSDLRGWAAQVGRAAGDLDAALGYATGRIADADFGRILELISGDYAALLPKVHGVLEADGTGIGHEQRALAASAAAYGTADRRNRDMFAELGGRGAFHATDDGEAAAFSDVTTPSGRLTPPAAGGDDLPEVSFGWAMDKVCDAITWVGGPDPREHVTQWIAGDVGKARAQAVAWLCVAECLTDVQANLMAGSDAIARTWEGAASSAAADQMRRWQGCLLNQSGAMREMSGYLLDAVDQAVMAAQVVVDIIKTVVDLVSAALTNASIPGYGQWKLISTVKEAITMVNNARKVLTVFWDLLKTVVDYIQLCMASFDAAALPSAPAAVPEPAGASR